MDLKKNNALTLVEVMITTLILAVAIGAIYSSLSTGNVSWQKYTNKMATQTKARLALEKMSKELREGSSISISQTATSASISFTRLGIGTITYSWTNTGGNANKILRTFGVVPTVLADYISALSFTNDAQSVTINITATKASALGASDSFSLKEKIAMR